MVGDEGGRVRTRSAHPVPLGQRGSRSCRSAHTAMLVAIFRRDAPARCGACAEDDRCGYGGAVNARAAKGGSSVPLRVLPCALSVGRTAANGSTLAPSKPFWMAGT